MAWLLAIGMVLERDIPKAHYFFPPLIIMWTVLLFFIHEGLFERVSPLALPGTIVFAWCEVTKRIIKAHWGGVGLYWGSILVGLYII